MSYVSSREAQKYYGVHPQTLRDWANTGKIQYQLTHGRHRRYWVPPPTTGKGKRYLYARVSSAKQSHDLTRQVDYLKSRYPRYEVITDIGSGLNFSRQGFRTILAELFAGDITEVVVAHSDRFSRFGAREFFGWVFEQFGATLTILEDQHSTSPQEELSRDLMEVITVFSARYHGRRKYDNKKDKDVSQFSPEEAV